MDYIHLLHLPSQLRLKFLLLIVRKQIKDYNSQSKQL